MPLVMPNGMRQTGYGLPRSLKYLMLPFFASSKNLVIRSPLIELAGYLELRNPLNQLIDLWRRINMQVGAAI